MTHPVVRASDADRERTVELLRQHSVDGRLTLEEFAERMALAYEAKTHDELEPLTVTCLQNPRPRRLGAASRPAGSSP